jgi:uncharacterized membrane protein
VFEISESGAASKAELQKEIAEAHSWSNAQLSAHSMTVNLPRSDVFTACRNFESFPTVSSLVETVVQRGDGSYEWTVLGEQNAVKTWEIVLTEERVDEAMAWTCDGDARHVGLITFRDAPQGRGTEVRVVLAYESPRGVLGKAVKAAQRREPSFLVIQEMRRLKQFLETGEVSTTNTSAAAPRGFH